jgi:hypothetical protein
LALASFFAEKAPVIEIAPEAFPSALKIPFVSFSDFSSCFEFVGWALDYVFSYKAS